MPDPSALEAATKRLSAALEGLEAAVERRQEVDRAGEAVAGQLQALGLDRSRLAAELDSAAARAKALEGNNREIARRVDLAIEAIRAVLDANDR